MAGCTDHLEKMSQLLTTEKGLCEMLIQTLYEYSKGRLTRIGHPDLVSDMESHCMITGSTVEGTMSARMFSSGIKDIEMDIMCQFGSIPEQLQDTMINSLSPPKPGYFRLVNDQQFYKSIHPWAQHKYDKYFCKKLGLGNATTFSSYIAKEISQKFFRFKDKSGKAPMITSWLFGIDVSSVKVEHTSSTNGPAITIEMCLAANEEKIAQISIDFVLCIKLESWPHCISNWRDRERNWPPGEVVKDIISNGCHIVPKPPPPSSENDEMPEACSLMEAPSNPSSDEEWRLSFSLAEKTLANMQTPEQRISYYVFKTIFYCHLKFELDGHCLPSYVAKTTMLWALEKRSPEDWLQGTMLNVGYLLSRLCRSLQERNVPHYFIPEINIVQNLCASHLEAAHQIVLDIQENPLMYLPADHDMDNVAHLITDLTKKTFDLHTYFNISDTLTAFKKLFK